MPRNRLVQEQRLHAPDRSRLDVVGVRIEHARAAAVGRSCAVLPARRRNLAKPLDAPYLEAGLGENVEQLFRQFADAVRHVAIALDQLFGFVEVELVVIVHEFEEILQIAFEADLFHHAMHLAMDARDFVQADLVNLAGCQIRRCYHLDVVGIPFCAIGQRV